MLHSALAVLHSVLVALHFVLTALHSAHMHFPSIILQAPGAAMTVRCHGLETTTNHPPEHKLVMAYAGLWVAILFVEAEAMRRRARREVAKS